MERINTEIHDKWDIIKKDGVTIDHTIKLSLSDKIDRTALSYWATELCAKGHTKLAKQVRTLLNVYTQKGENQ